MRVENRVAFVDSAAVFVLGGVIRQSRAGKRGVGLASRVARGKEIGGMKEKKIEVSVVADGKVERAAMWFSSA